MTSEPGRRGFLCTLAALGLAPHARADTGTATTLIGACWRGPKAGDTHHAGVLAADWERGTLSIRYQVPLPGRPHGLVAEAGGGLLVNGLRPGAWLLRCDGAGQVTQRLDVEKESATVRLSGHVAMGADVLYTTEIDYRNHQGRIGVRDRATLNKLDEWASGGIEPHQALLDEAGHLLVANGGVRRTWSDQKIDLARMDSSLARLDGRTGRTLGLWKLSDARLSQRHIAWSRPPQGGRPWLGIAMQAEHSDPVARATAPILAVFDGENLSIPTRDNDGHGYAGDISAAYNGGFALSSNKAGVAKLWHPGEPDKLSAIVEMEESYALADWPGPQPGGGVLVATAFGLVRWHIATKGTFLRWPQPMALDNHWVPMA
ncbi:MAG TPA: DUF1513 domain-containing protein [Roseateles sp.]